MVKKKRFILELPYFLATDAASLNVKLLFVSCYVALMAGYLFPVFGTLAAAGYCLTVWQVIKIRKNLADKYQSYCSFLLQRVIFAIVFTLGLFLYCSKTGMFDINTWYLSIILLGVLNISDIFFTLKGFTGVVYINGKKN